MSNPANAVGSAGQPALRSVVQVASAAIVLGSMTVTFALSLAAIIYAGPLAPFLSHGIALTLIGAVVMGVVGPLALTYRGSLIQPQDVTAILLALAAAAIAGQPGLAPESAFSTVVVLIGLTSIATGIAAYAMGAFKLGYLVRFVPFPVISGFLAASGALLIGGAFDMVAPPDAPGWADFLVGNWPVWLPWLLLAAVMVVVARALANDFAIPATLALALIAFYPVTWMLGVDLAAARELGLLLGPFQSQSFASGLSLDLFSTVDWRVLLAQFPITLTIVGIALLGTLLNASGLELAIDREIDFERDLKGVGISNIAAGLGGGLVGYHILSETLLARRFGLTGAAAGFTVAGASLAALFFGADLLSYLPIGIFAAVIWYLGFDLLLTAIWDHGLRMPRLDFAIVLVTPLIALVFGFMPAVTFGIVVATLLFVVAYSSVDTARLSTTGANFPARIERSPADAARLSELGRVVQIHKLNGYLFFGSASRLVSRLQGQFAQTPLPRFAIVDLKHVVGMDSSAWAAFDRLARMCRQQGTELLLTGLSTRLRNRFDPDGNLSGGRELDDVLVDVEERLLSEDRTASAATKAGSTTGYPLPDELAALLRKYGYWMNLAAGDTLMAQGARSDHLVFLLEGRCRAAVWDRNGDRRVVSRFLPGAILGEIAYYAGVPRTASIIAETSAVGVRMDADALARMEREDPAVAASFHRMLAVVLARRLMTTTRLLNDAEL
jgi:SulP family sulfate permease